MAIFILNKYYFPVFFFLIACGTARKSDQEIFSEQQRKVLDPVKDVELKVEKSELEETLISQGLVDIEEVIPEIKVELKYSTADNFFGQDVYGELTKAFLQPEVAERLKKAQEMLQNEYPDYTLLVYDGVRPLSVQQILWDNLNKPDSLKPLYVADPKVGSLHNFGVAVDLTLFDMKADSVLDMGTGYDYFGYLAYPDRESQMLKGGRLTSTHIANRQILRKIMTLNGFTGIGSEWWHFNAYSRNEAGKKFKIIE